jgi:hypothetical protein
MSAAICRRGHVITVRMEQFDQIGERCTTCGARILIACPECGHRLRGEYYVEGVLGWSADTPRPSFCDKCGTAFPWVDRQGRIYELQNRLDDEGLDPAIELAVREQLDALLDPDMDEKEAARIWKRVIESAPGLWEKTGAKKIIESVATAYVLKQLEN